MARLSLVTPSDIQAQISARLKRLRLRRELTQSTLAKKSGVSMGSLKRFEATGEISLINLLKLAAALDTLDKFGELFPMVEAIDLAGLEKKKSLLRKRGNK